MKDPNNIESVNFNFINIFQVTNRQIFVIKYFVKIKTQYILFKRKIITNLEKFYANFRNLNEKILFMNIKWLVMKNTKIE